MNVELAPSARPFAYADPRSLSQAWYDALYGSHQKPAARDTAARSETPSPVETSETKARQFSPEGPGSERAALDVPHAAVRAQTRESALGLGETTFEELRAKARAATAPRTTAQAARTDVELDDPAGGTVRLLVAEHGGSLEVIAVCEREARERTADALARARIALAARGVSLQTAIRERGTA